jgi:hypothetical protein
MTREARQIATALAAAAFVAAYVACEVLHVPTIWYRPLEHRWSLSSGPGIAMGWYGHVLEACGVAAATLGASVVALRRARPHRRLAGLAVLGCASTFMLAVSIEILGAT